MDNNRKPYVLYQTVTLPMTLSDPNNSKSPYFTFVLSFTFWNGQRQRLIRVFKFSIHVSCHSKYTV